MLRLTTLDAIEAAVWIELSRAVRDKAHAWRTPVLATVDGHVSPPRADARTVVLREVDEAHRRLVFFTDSRSPKASQIAGHSHATIVFWSAPMNWQLRCDVQLSIDVDSPLVAERWARIRSSPAAADYLSFAPPGSRIDGGATLPLDQPNFAVITAEVQSIDWLELHPQGHRRACFSAGERAWLQP
jgi:pyridoxamine 5'-phosphate oxidase